MIKLKSELNTRPRRHGARWLLLLLVAAPLAGLVEERWRGQSALKNWQHNMAAKGETFDAAKLWPPVTARSVEFSNQLTQVSKKFPARLQVYSGSLTSIILDESGQARRGSQEACPPINPQTFAGNQTNTWQGLNDLLQHSQPALHQLRELMKDPPTGINYDVAKLLDGDSIPNFVASRIAAQALYASALNNLHQGNLDGATQDLEALLSFGKLGEQNPFLVSFMIRMAILGLSIDVCWDALQAEGWTEPQLAALQSQCLDITNVLSQLPHTLEAERIARIHALDWFRSHTYHAWVARYKEINARFGLQPSLTDAALPVRVRRQWLFHPLWSFAWVDQEELKYLQDVQSELTALRETSRKPSYLWLREQLTASHQNYRAPSAAWRFYTKLPLRENLGDAFIVPKVHDSSYPYPDFSKAWFTTMKNLTRHELVITAIALKRYELKHGKSPADLAALVPGFLPALPCDLMDGRPLRYRLELNGDFTLYSVGDDAHDDGGSAVPRSDNYGAKYSPAWNRKDMVWPQAAGSVKGPHIAKTARHNSGEQPLQPPMENSK